jgi:hypothetical protein
MIKKEIVRYCKCSVVAGRIRVALNFGKCKLLAEILKAPNYSGLSTTGCVNKNGL